MFSDCVTQVISETAIAEHRAEPITVPMNTLTRGWTMVRKACGSTTNRRVPKNPSPIERAASACPTGTVLMTERTYSHTKADDDSVSHSITHLKYGMDRPNPSCPLACSRHLR